MALRQRAAALLRQAVQQSWADRFADTAAVRAAQRFASSSAQSTARRIYLEGPPTHIPTAEEAAATSRWNAITAGALLAAAGGTYYAALKRNSEAAVKPPTDQHLVNWSGTHECHAQRFYQPESLAELEALVKQAHSSGQKLRCVGSALSPNGLAFEAQGMVSLALLDRIVKVDAEKRQVTVQAGARVRELTEALRPHGLVLQNYASIREQTVGGLTQVSAHGSGAAIPPVDERVVGLKIVTPALGTLDLSEDNEPELFRLARVGLGCLGVVAEVTIQCVPAHRLLERTFVATPAEVRRHHRSWLAAHRHLRYMWIPCTDAVVVVQSDPVGPGAEAVAEAEAAAAGKFGAEERVQPLRALLEKGGMAASEAAKLSATQCRDALLGIAPLDPGWVAKVNAAEAEFWRRSAGSRVGWSDELLGFDCGGEQWVHEVALPAGTAEHPSGAELAYMEQLLALIKKQRVPAPAPIEQRWSSGSASPMSPSHGPPEALHSWVGIIMYLPAEGPQRQDVTAAFSLYRRLVEAELMGQYNAVEHWAKIEVPQSEGEVQEMRARLAKRYPLAEFAAARRRVDPRNILGNQLVDVLLAPAAGDGKEAAAQRSTG